MYNETFTRKIALYRYCRRIVVDVILAEGRNSVDQNKIVPGTITS